MCGNINLCTGYTSCLTARLAIHAISAHPYAARVGLPLCVLNPLNAGATSVASIISVVSGPQATQELLRCRCHITYRFTRARPCHTTRTRTHTQVLPPHSTSRSSRPSNMQLSSSLRSARSAAASSGCALASRPVVACRRVTPSVTRPGPFTIATGPLLPASRSKAGGGIRVFSSALYEFGQQLKVRSYVMSTQPSLSYVAMPILGARGRPSSRRHVTDVCTVFTGGP